ncbi:MAG: MlrC C-terminal domain-containing protein [Anaerolineae bacterium]|nr:MlrC C-terminal domain-containing protein [Anaerolineae bacterium]
MDYPLGNTASLRINGIDIVLISLRTQTFSPEVFTNLGIDPTKRQLVIVKSTQHFYGRFAPIAAEVLYIAAPGAVVPDFKNIPYKYADTNKYPMVENPMVV